ncbi:hypothetical protein B0H13DRAFT_1855768 [Mycena leptocephala]|nr:hypothetical protein B0H13DRAFT_1882587 [Mycena leptocephala]KAJ7933916.1 hypothetical protein B0H13DRAFT_1855768 [Mycena leptocephala]
MAEANTKSGLEVSSVEELEEQRLYFFQKSSNGENMKMMTADTTPGFSFAMDAIAIVNAEDGSDTIASEIIQQEIFVDYMLSVISGKLSDAEIKKATLMHIKLIEAAGRILKNGEALIEKANKVREAAELKAGTISEHSTSDTKCC